MYEMGDCDHNALFSFCKSGGTIQDMNPIIMKTKP